MRNSQKETQLDFLRVSSNPMELHPPGQALCGLFVTNYTSIENNDQCNGL